MDTESATSVEVELEGLVERWTSHMRWRSDFDEWRQKRIRQEDWQEGRVRSLQDLCGWLEGRRLLDSGCGMGGLAVALLKKGALVSAMDYNADYCRITDLRSQRHGLNLGIANGAGEALPFATRTFDVVTCLDVLEHVQNPIAGLSEIARVLRPGGVAVVTATNRFAFRDPHYHLRGINWMPRSLAERLVLAAGRSKSGSRFSDRQALSDMHYFSYRNFRRLCERMGFDVTDAREHRLNKRAQERSHGKRELLRLMWGLPGSSVAYGVYRFFFMGTFEVRLEKKR